MYKMNNRETSSHLTTPMKHNNNTKVTLRPSIIISLLLCYYNNFSFSMLYLYGIQTHAILELLNYILFTEFFAFIKMTHASSSYTEVSVSGMSNEIFSFTLLKINTIAMLKRISRTFVS
jgi:hypothetical protein